jgi:hypothetical protein
MTELNTIETTLRDVLAVRTSVFMGAILKANDWPLPTEEQGRELSHSIIRILTAIVVGLRQADALPPSQEELSTVLQGIAYGALGAVMGLCPPAEPVTIN